VSLINYSFYKKLKIDNPVSGISTIRTIGGPASTNGTVFLRLKIFKVEKVAPFLIMKKDLFEEDLLLGLDCIKAF
jgi:hypothetical protein